MDVLLQDMHRGNGNGAAVADPVQEIMDGDGVVAGLD